MSLLKNCRTIAPEGNGSRSRGGREGKRGRQRIARKKAPGLRVADKQAIFAGEYCNELLVTGAVFNCGGPDI